MITRVACPHLKEPFEDCHVSLMDSSNIREAIKYCTGSYEECEVYRLHAEAGELEPSAKEGR
jgi:hypothetical protein